MYSSIKIAGLTIGMTCVLLATLFVRDENSYDRFHSKASQLYRITTTIRNPNDEGARIVGATGQVQGPAFKAGIPDIQEYARIWPGLSTNFIEGDKHFFVNYLYADEAFFRMFSFPLLHGNPETALEEPNSIVLTEQTARRFFGRTDVVGKTISFEEGHGLATFVITGVAKTIPFHSSIQFEAVLPFTYLQTMFRDDNWLNPYLHTFVLLNEHADLTGVKNKFSRIFLIEAANQLQNAKMQPSMIRYGLQPITDIHLNIFERGASVVKNDDQFSNASFVSYSYILMSIAAFILMMACVNFLNLSIAGALTRSKEIGVRKISGGTNSQIVLQFLTETTILCGISYLLAILFTGSILPIFNRLAQKSISFSFPSDAVFFLYGLLLMILCIIIVGVYPSIKLSLFNAVEVLYDKQKSKGKNVFAKSLIVLQFTLAVSLIIATTIYYRQMNFIMHEDLGYKPNDIVKIDWPNFRKVNQQTINSFRNQLFSETSIVQVTNGDLIPTGGGYVVNLPDNKIVVSSGKIDQDFLPTLNIQIKEGRNFAKQFSGDSSRSVIVNETFIEKATLKNPIGQQIALTDGLGVTHSKTIVGVVKDFHYASLRERIAPMVFIMDQSESVWIKLQKGRTPEGLLAAGKVFRTMFPDYPYSYSFMEDDIKEQYADEQRWKQIIGYASALAIVICCIGLFGLAHFSTLRRTKEVGIRKVLGASAMHISQLLSQDFLKLVILAILLASPIGWIAMDRWLKNFSYRIHISWMDFGAAAFIALIIALITVSSQAFRAAMANPVKSLRIE
jgi:putative ABC transport system permease protein